MSQTLLKKDDHYEVVADIPGVDKDDIKVDYEDGTLQISATRHEIKDHSDKDGNILQSERSFGSVGRSYYLPNVDNREGFCQVQERVLHASRSASR